MTEKVGVASPSTYNWFDFELIYPHYDVEKWMITNRSLSILFGAIYLMLLLIGRRFMESRQPFQIRKSLACWNALMFTLSISVLLRLASFTFKRVFRTSLYHQVCQTDFEDEPLIFWLDLFVVTKPIEFIDTAFIVLRKQPLHFLHYYHHCTVVILCWYSLGMAPVPPNSLYYVAMNSFVHTIMYLYYFLRSVRFSLPRPLQMSITALQIAQMAVGCFINVSALIYRHLGLRCDAAFESIILALGIYSCYFVLFADYFRKAYFLKSSSPPSAPSLSHSSSSQQLRKTKRND